MSQQQSDPSGWSYYEDRQIEQIRAEVEFYKERAEYLQKTVKKQGERIRQLENQIALACLS